MEKSALREGVRQSRRERSASDREQVAQALARQLRPLLPNHPVDVTAYRSMPTEPGTAPIIDLLRTAGHRVWLPRVDGPVLTWVRIDEDTEFRPGPLGIEEPAGPADATFPSVAIALLPGLAADRHGWRLGQGGGFYDRALSAVPSHADGGPLRVLLLHDDEVVDAVPREPHDCRVDVILAPSQVIRTSV